MGFFEKLFGSAPKPRGRYDGQYKMLTGYEPTFHRFGGSIYEDALVRAAINTIATHVSKLEVATAGAAKPQLQNKLKHGPNEFQTWSQFLSRLATIYYIHNTAFIVPVFDQYGEVSGIYPVLPDKCEVVKYEGVEMPFLRFKFSWGEYAAIEMDRVGVMTRFQYKSDVFGESNRALHQTMDLISIQNQGIQEGVKNGASFRFMARVKNFSLPSDLALERKRFNAVNFSRDAEGGGILLLPNTYDEIKQLESKPYVADAEQMKLIRENVFEYFGVNEAILTSAAYGDAWSAFYESIIEPFAIQFSEAATKMLFTFNEQSRGSYVMATANRLQYMTNADKLAVSAQMADRGLMTRNEIRQIWNLPPLPEPIGSQLPVRGEYYNVGEEGGEEDGQENGNQSV